MSNANIKRVRSSDIELKDKLVAVNRVTKVTKGGRTFSFSAIVVVGNEKGIVGYGLGKAKEVTDAISKGVDDAKKTLRQVPCTWPIETVVAKEATNNEACDPAQG
jgi:small subunit ribosomal protein S5